MDLCKSRMIISFNREFARSRDQEKAFQAGLDDLNTNALALGITSSKRMMAGLVGELRYFAAKHFEEHLIPASASGSHVDFTGLIRKRAAAIDVTTSPRYKDPNKVKKAARVKDDAYDYYIGVVEKRGDPTISPFLLPVCDDGNLGHFILVVLESDTETLRGRSDYQALVRYNPYAEDADNALEKVEETYRFDTDYPGTLLADLTSDIDDADPNWAAKQRIEAAKTFDRFMFQDAQFFKRESGLVLSAIVTHEWRWFSKDVGDYETEVAWAHPNGYIRSAIGRKGSTLDYDIAGVLDSI